MTDTMTVPDLEQVRQIADPWERAQQIAHVLVPAEKQLRKARTDRDLAALVGVEEHGWPPVKAYQMIGVSRGLFVRMRRRGPDELPKLKDPERVAKRAAADVDRLEKLIEEWKPLRDDTIWELFDARTDLNYAEIGRLFGVTGQRISIMRSQGR